MADAVLELRSITKLYPGVTALDGVSLVLAEGEVLGLVGENGAGKSTLMKILGGVVAPTRGTIHIAGRVLDALTVPEAIGAGIAFVHQELNLFDNLDAASNIFIGREPLHGGPLRLVDRRRLYAAARPLLERLGADFAPDAPVAGLSLAQRQLIEIAKALSLDARVVIMDEPSSSLALAETRRLLDVVADLRRAGVGVIYISHRLHEIEDCADRVIVLRDGRLAGELGRGAIEHDAMIRLMIGRDLRALYAPPGSPAGGAGLEIDGLRTTAYPSRAVSLRVRAGEIVGLAGLVGAGRSEVARTAFGIDRAIGGSVRIDGVEIVLGRPRAAIARGFYLVPEDRKRSGVLLDLPIAQNISLPDLPRHATAGLVRPAREVAAAERQRERLGIRAPSVAVDVATLSGGNQQKVALAKWLAMRPRAIIFDEPTRGIDVGAKTEIYAIMRALADAGVAVLMISSDMEEVIGVSDRIAVMHEGRISGFLERERFSEHNVLMLAVGRRAA